MKQRLLPFVKRMTSYVAAAAVVVALLGLITLAKAAAPTLPEGKSRVVLLQAPEAVHKFAVDANIVRERFTQALLALTGEATTAAAWQRGLGIRSSDVVGIKITTGGGPVMATRRALVDAIIDSLREAGVRPERVIVWDKFADQMTPAGYPPKPATPGQRIVTSVIPGLGFDPKAFYFHEVPGVLIWGDSEFVGKKMNRDELLQAAHAAAAGAPPLDGNTPSTPATPTERLPEQISNRSHFARLLTQRCTKIINVPSLADHATLGLNGCLASLALGSVDNTRRFTEEATERSGYAAAAVAELASNDVFRKKTVLHVLDGLVAQIAGGPAFAPRFCQSIGVVYLSQDPVAVDSLAAKWLARARQAAGVVPPADPFDFEMVPKAAAAKGLGRADVNKIQLERIGAGSIPEDFYDR